MATLEERVAFLEGKMEEYCRGLDGVRAAIVHLEQRVDTRLEAVDRRLDALDLKLDQRTDGLRADLSQLDQKVSREFVWLVGAHMTTLLAIVGAVVAALLTR